MGSKDSGDWGMAALTGGLSLLTPKQPKMPEAPKTPPPVEAVDVAGQSQYTKKKAAERKGRRSTILGSQRMGSTNQGKKEVLG
jgi:hypothetical protein